MSVVANRDVDHDQFVIEDISTGLHASGFGSVGDGRSFSFHVERQTLLVEVYRLRLRALVPQAEDVVATATRDLSHVDLTDERSLGAAVRDAVSDAQPVPRSHR
ncbi:hypothetical protein [Mycolicibacterium grossiae]|uniref:Uncharacterized protein n=1 Tax=Mycolicibacterium grossiae TaxID=1552759 RepID=A0A1E8QA60_9MYCO|nr:hypothetical protein [Mycolicibacterium grossiae]OFJ55478.1 hypothetical protein BEL07_02200 [Mycolicibacterium grossiae]QEM47072.1 hypothetical protein FZ046_21905 [Mycolicibacterium grossiae]